MPILFAVAFASVLASPSGAAKLYKWVDENGNVRYSDQIPPSAAKRGHSELNSQGVVVSTQQKAKSEAELAAEAKARREQEAREAEQARLKKIQQQKDQVLLMTFSSEEELELARQDRVEVLESVIKLIANSIETYQEKLAALQDNADKNFLSQGKEVPGGLAQKIEHAQRKIETRTRQLEQKMAEKEKINQKYQLDLARYRELTVEGGDSN
ncbi:MAG: DUF4124 domain-containing protein [Gammaproteobacteria bacterium]